MILIYLLFVEVNYIYNIEWIRCVVCDFIGNIIFFYWVRFNMQRIKQYQEKKYKVMSVIYLLVVYKYLFLQFLMINMKKKYGIEKKELFQNKE